MSPGVGASQRWGMVEVLLFYRSPLGQVQFWNGSVSSLLQILGLSLDTFFCIVLRVPLFYARGGPFTALASKYHFFVECFSLF